MLPVTDGLPELELKVFNSGWVPANKKLVLSGARSEKIKMPALFAMLRHPTRGVILYDTGYSTRFYEATAKMPYRVMRALTPAQITEENNADRQLARLHVPAEEVKTIILGHGHADHVPGVAYFPKAKLIVDRAEWDFMHRPTLRAFRHAYLKPLYDKLPNQVEFIDWAVQGKEYGPFHKTVDLFQDGSLILVPLPGHTPGQTGLLVNLTARTRLFFIGDAAWVAENYLLQRPPAAIARSIIYSSSDYMATLRLVHDIHHAHPELTVVPSHCPTAWARLSELGLVG